MTRPSYWFWAWQLQVDLTLFSEKKGAIGFIDPMVNFASLLEIGQDSIFILGRNLLGEKSMDFHNSWSGAWLPSNPKLSVGKFSEIIDAYELIVEFWHPNFVTTTSTQENK